MKVKTTDKVADLPKSFVLFGSTYTVEIDNVANDWKESMGLFSDNMKKIKLATQLNFNKLPADSVLDTYYHELAHALVYNTGEIDYYKNEQFVEILGKLLRQYINTVKY